MKKGDIILCSAICVFSALLALLFLTFKNNGKTLIVKVDNKPLYEYSLGTDREIELEHNTAVIKDGEVYMLEADCKNQICVRTGKISKRGECIVCLPNRVILEIK
ncbi:MAG: NusG domain II-containing protein [Clostridia bacterium]|nr:NusG domain II-containing protein [Clostridia bacterium]